MNESDVRSGNGSGDKKFDRATRAITAHLENGIAPHTLIGW